MRLSIWLGLLLLLITLPGWSAPADSGFTQRALWTWDHRMDFSGKTPGRVPMGGGGKYHKAAGEYLEDYKRLIDYMHDHTSFNAVIIWGFLRDTHGGVAAGQELCEYANERGIRIIPGVGTSGYGGYYFEGEHEYNVRTWLTKHPELQATGKDGKPRAVLCPSKPENATWLQDGCRWLFENFKVGGINFEIGDFFVCYCDDCDRARAALPGDAADYYKDMAISIGPVAKLARELSPDAWLSYATYTGFDPEMMGEPPSWIQLVPKEIECQWTLTGMVSDEGWPEGLRPPTTRNTGYLHWGNKSTQTQHSIYLRRIQDVCRRASAAGFAGLTTYGEDPPSLYSMRLLYDAWSFFLDDPDASVEDYADQRLSEWFGSSDDGRRLLAILLELERRGVCRSSLAPALGNARAHRAEAESDRAAAAWDELIAFLTERLAEIEQADKVIEEPEEVRRAMAEGFRVTQDSSTTLVMPGEIGDTLRLLVRVDYSMENGLLPVMRLTLNGQVLGPAQAIDRPEMIRTPNHEAYQTLAAFEAAPEAWRVKYDTDFEINSDAGRKYDTHDYDPWFAFDISGLVTGERNVLKIENLEARFRPSEKGVLVVGEIELK